MRFEWKRVKMAVKRLLTVNGWKNGMEKMIYEQCWFSIWWDGGFGGHHAAYKGRVVFHHGNVIYAKGQ